MPSIHETRQETYADVTQTLRQLTRKNIKFIWTTECQERFEELKTLLTSDKVLANYDPARPTRLYVDDGLAGVAATVAQPHELEAFDHSVWIPIIHTNRAKTTAKMNHRKVDGESLAILSGIHSNNMYLYGTKFTAVDDHEPLVALYNLHSQELLFRVAKHKITIRWI